jgi:hypothetical protein
MLDSLIHTKAHGADCKHVRRLPLSQHKLELGTCTSEDFSNLLTAAPLHEETERSLIHSLIHDLNELLHWPLPGPGDRQIHGEEAFLNDKIQRQNLGDQLKLDQWEVTNLCKPGFQISKYSVAEVIEQIEELKRTVPLDYSIIILQLYDDNV